MSKTAFPLGKGRGYQLGAKWEWRVDQLDVSGVECRLLTALQAEKSSFMAMLTVRQDQDFVVVASYEFHSDHPGWHVHACCDDVDKIDVGLARPRDSLRIPGVKRKHRRDKFGNVSQSTALNIAFEFFNVKGTPRTEAAQGSLL